MGKNTGSRPVPVPEAVRRTGTVRGVSVTDCIQRPGRKPATMRDYSFITELHSDELRLEAYRELSRQDLYFFASQILKYDLETQTDIHYRFCSIADMERMRQLYLMFRGSFKTSLGVAKVIQWLIKNPAAQIGIGSDKVERAVERVKDVRRVLETNELLKEVFADVFYREPTRESNLWTNEAFNVRRPADKLVGFSKPSVSAFGLFPLPTGSHFTHVLLDDVENEENVNTPELIQQLNIRVSSLMPVLQPQAPVMMLGTIYCPTGPNTIYQSLWPTYKVPIIDNQGMPTFPSKYPQTIIEQYRRDINDDYVWQGQYMLKAALRTEHLTFPFRHTILNTFEEIRQ